MFGADADLGYPTGDESPLAPPGTLNEATRWMCSRVLVDPSQAERTFGDLCLPRPEPFAPSPGVDLPALASHAAWAVRDERNVLVRVTLLLAAAVGLLVARAVGVLDGGSWRLVLGSAAALLAVAVAALVHRRAFRAGIAGRIFAEGTALRAADLADAEQHARLDAANEGNLLVYGDRRTDGDGPTPGVFLGFGRLAGHEVRVPVDMDRPLDSSQPPGRVRPYDLLARLESQVPRHIGQTALVERCAAGLVAHVLDREVRPGSDLLDSPEGPVHALAPHDFVRETADRPTRGARTYVRAQVVGHGGQLVTTLHLTAVVGPTGLSVNFVVHVMRPLHPVWAMAGGVPRTAWGQWWYYGTRPAVWASVVRAPYDAVRLHLQVRRGGRGPDTGRPRPRPRQRTRPSYAAQTPVRERASSSSGLRFNEGVDLQRQANDLMRAVFAETGRFLEERNIDPAPFLADEQAAAQQVTTNISTMVIGAVFRGHTNVGGDLYANTTAVWSQVGDTGEEET